LDIHNVLVVSGDPLPGSKVFIPEEEGYAHAIEIDMNKGIYIDPELINPQPTDFSVGVAGSPEKHPESPNFESDIHFLKKKIEAGAEYIVTQMFFDNRKFFEFEERCRKAGINVPVILGIKPVSTRKQLTYLPKTFNIDMPEELLKEILKCKNNKEVYELGIEWGIHQVRELMNPGVPVIHFYTMGRTDNVRKIAEEVF